MPTVKKKPASPSSAARKPRTSRASATARTARTAGTRRKSKSVAPPKPRWSEQYEKAVGDYAGALREVQQRNWSRARELLEKLLNEYADSSDLLDITDRARSYLRVCLRNLASDPGEQDPFLLGVYHGNRGEHDEAIRMFESALASNPNSDKVLYAIAAIRSQKGDREGAIDSLRRSIGIDDRNRVYALNDSDFDPIRDEPEFIDLVEPEEAGGPKI